MMVKSHSLTIAIYGTQFLEEVRCAICQELSKALSFGSKMVMCGSVSPEDDPEGPAILDKTAIIAWPVRQPRTGHTPAINCAHILKDCRCGILFTCGLGTCLSMAYATEHFLSASYRRIPCCQDRVTSVPSNFSCI